MENRAELQRIAQAAVVARWGRHRELDDLLVIAEEAVDAELRAGAATTYAELERYALRRVRCDCIDYLRRVSRQDPLRRPLRPQPRTRMIKISCRVSVELLADAARATSERSITGTIRRALERAASNADRN